MKMLLLLLRLLLLGGSCGGRDGRGVPMSRFDGSLETVKGAVEAAVFSRSAVASVLVIEDVVGEAGVIHSRLQIPQLARVVRIVLRTVLRII